VTRTGGWDKIGGMSTAVVLDREEYIEQSHFFRTFRERLAHNLAAQEILERLHEEILSTTRLPMAIQFLATEIKHAGLLSSGFARLSHYFTAFQTYVISQAEQEGQRLTMPTALLVLERMANYLAEKPTKPGLFVYQFETISRNRLGYDEGLASMAADPFYDADWTTYFDMVRRQVGSVDFGDLLYVRSELYVMDQRRMDSTYEPPVPPLFGEKEGKIAKASRGRDPLFLFAALQRQLNYPEVPRTKERDDLTTKLELMQTKMRELETRIKLVEGEMKGQVDLSQFKPEMFKDMPTD
jgi:RNAse (barnase) inhibitor barstar